MKLLVLIAAAIGTAVALEAAPQNCSPADSVLCPACSGNNITDKAGVEYTISCNYEIVPELKEEVDGHTSIAICMEACDESDDCFGINFATDGDCWLAKGKQKGFRRHAGYSNLVRLSDTVSITSTSFSTSTKQTKTSTTSHVDITTTVFGSGAVQTLPVAISTTSSAAAASTGATDDECNLQLTNLCPKCNGREVGNKGGQVYRISCGIDVDTQNGTYSPQEWMTPQDCLEECDKLGFCNGTVYYDDRNCEILKGPVISTKPDPDYTAFLPVAIAAATQAPSSVSKTSSASAQVTSPAVLNTTLSAPGPYPTYSIQPIPSGCDLNALSCPACNGMPYIDKVNSSYTVLCDFEPICDSVAVYRDGADTQEQCVQGCTQDVTCLAVMYWPQSSACHLCQQGMDAGIGENLPYVVLVADNDGDDSPIETGLPGTATDVTLTLTLPADRTSTGSITDLPAPFTTSTSVGPVGPVGPVMLTRIPSARAKTTGGFTTSAKTAIHLSTTALPASVTNIGAVACPSIDNDAYLEPESGNYFAVACDNIFTAAHSQYVSAPNFEACAASCTGQCDGVQFGYTTRCGLYTDISVIGPAKGWTVAASITHPTPFSTAATSTTGKAPAAYSTLKIVPTSTGSPKNATGPKGY